MLNGIFVAGPESRDFEVTFKPLSASIQQNDCRDLLIAYQGAPALETGRKVAERLRSVTDKRSGADQIFEQLRTSVLSYANDDEQTEDAE